jgi:hypothetical protein
MTALLASDRSVPIRMHGAASAKSVRRLQTQTPPPVSRTTEGAEELSENPHWGHESLPTPEGRTTESL